jgi:hypothetical protein
MVRSNFQLGYFSAILELKYRPLRMRTSVRVGLEATAQRLAVARRMFSQGRANPLRSSQPTLVPDD